MLYCIEALADPFAPGEEWDVLCVPVACNLTNFTWNEKVYLNIVVASVLNYWIIWMMFHSVAFQICAGFLNHRQSDCKHWKTIESPNYCGKVGLTQILRFKLNS